MNMPRLLTSICSCALVAAAWSTPGAGQSSFRSAAGVRTAQETRASNPRITLYGGLATGDGPFGIGPALAASFRWDLAQLPFDFRLDPYFATHSLEDDGDGSIWLLGASGNIEFPFRTTGSNTEPYLFGGVGLYFNSVSIDIPGEGDFDDTSLDAGFGLGGGVRFGGLTLEAKMRDIDEFTTVSFLVGFMLGGR
jgi:hypothetical protein